MAQLSNVYDADFTMVGNNMFFPGKRLYFDPSSLSPTALGKPSDPGSMSHMMGLGGYHIVTTVKSYIESGKFETVVTARWETGGGLAEAHRRKVLLPDDEVGGEEEC